MCFIESARVQYSFERRPLVAEALITELVSQCEKSVNVNSIVPFKASGYCVINNLGYISSHNLRS